MGTTPQLPDEAYLALCVWDEARGEIAQGKRAVADVVLNRARKQYSSDGTIRGTVLSPNQFSGFYFDFVNGRYQRVCHDEEGADLRAHRMLHQAEQTGNAWTASVEQARAALEHHLPAWISNDTVLYYNPAVVHAPPAWATPDKYVTTIGHHAFYKA